MRGAISGSAAAFSGDKATDCANTAELQAHDNFSCGVPMQGVDEDTSHTSDAESARTHHSFRMSSVVWPIGSLRRGASCCLW